MFEDLPSFSISSFLDISLSANFFNPKKEDLATKKYLLLDTTNYLAEKKFADIYFGWNLEGLYFKVIVKSILFEKDSSKKDSFELFIDTRALKTKGYITKYCHHFIFFKEKIENGIQAEELTRFIKEDSHLLAIPSDFKIKTTVKENSYILDIFIKSSLLYGYEPSSFKKIAMTYKVNSFQKEPQHFSCSSKEFSIEKEPYLWSTFLLKK